MSTELSLILPALAIGQYALNIPLYGTVAKLDFSYNWCNPIQYSNGQLYFKIRIPIPYV